MAGPFPDNAPAGSPSMTLTVRASTSTGYSILSSRCSGSNWSTEWEVHARQISACSHRRVRRKSAACTGDKWAEVTPSSVRWYPIAASASNVHGSEPAAPHVPLIHATRSSSRISNTRVVGSICATAAEVAHSADMREERWVTLPRIAIRGRKVGRLPSSLGRISAFDLPVSS